MVFMSRWANNKWTPVASGKMQYHYFSHNSVTAAEKSDRLLCNYPLSVILRNNLTVRKVLI